MKGGDSNDLVDRARIPLSFMGTMFVELAAGVRRDRIPAHVWCSPGLLIATLLVCRVDAHVLKPFNVRPLHGWPRFSAIVACAFSGWLLWALRRAGKRASLLARLGDAFEACGWKSLGRYPSLVEDVEVDERTRKLRLKTAGVTISEFLAEKEKFEHMMNVSVVRMLMDESDKRRIEIFYSFSDLPKETWLERAETYVDGDFPIGVSMDGPVRTNFRNVPHILVAGESGGGKSNFMKVAASTLSAGNPDARVLFLDFKGGMETADLKSQAQNMRDNFTFVEGTTACAKELVSLAKELSERMKHFADIGASNFDVYQKARLRAKREGDRAYRPERRHFILADEVPEIFKSRPEISKVLAADARAALNKIARQGRAAGFHLVVSVQKPDAASFDQTVKANMPGIVCFPMPNQSASVTAVGTKRAYEIDPKIKGRAIWKYGPEVIEVQTYRFSGSQERSEAKKEEHDGNVGA